MARSNPQSMLRYPLDTHPRQRCERQGPARELFGHGGELSAPSLVLRSGLAQSTVREALIDLEEMKIIETLGSGRARVFRIASGHPLATTLGSLFQAEDHRFESVLEAVRAAAARIGSGVVAVWLYGSVARGGRSRHKRRRSRGRDAERDALPGVEEAMRDDLRVSEDGLAFTASVLAVDIDNVVGFASRTTLSMSTASTDAVNASPSSEISRSSRIASSTPGGALRFCVTTARSTSLVARSSASCHAAVEPDRDYPRANSRCGSGKRPRGRSQTGGPRPGTGNPRWWRADGRSRYGRDTPVLIPASG